jgi:hypothetical protein
MGCLDGLRFGGFPISIRKKTFGDRLKKSINMIDITLARHICRSYKKHISEMYPEID